MRQIPLTIGQRFGRWTVLRELPRRNAHRMVECKCDCGTVKSLGFQSIRRGETGSRSCGCLQKELQTIHGEWKSTEYRIWALMKQRCGNPHSKSWKNYGGRGIHVYQPWNDSFSEFLAGVGKRPSMLYSLDRWPNMNGNYEPGNVRWATASQQIANRRKTMWERIVILLAGKEATTVLEMVSQGKQDYEISSHIARCFKPLDTL